MCIVFAIHFYRKDISIYRYSEEFNKSSNLVMNKINEKRKSLINIGSATIYIEIFVLSAIFYPYYRQYRYNRPTPCRTRSNRTIHCPPPAPARRQTPRGWHAPCDRPRPWQCPARTRTAGLWRQAGKHRPVLLRYPSRYQRTNRASWSRGS